MSDGADYGAPAELFPSPRNRGRPLRYRRFATLAEAVRFAQEELSEADRAGALIEADEIRYSGAEIAALYDADGYPLLRGPLHH
jgi:hypothetical protein